MSTVRASSSNFFKRALEWSRNQLQDRLNPPNKSAPPAKRESVIPRDGFDPARAPRARMDGIESRAPGRRTVVDAVYEADQLLRGAAISRNTDQGATVTRDPAYADDSRDLNPLSRRHKDAKAQLEANASLETSTLQRLSAKEREAYLGVKNGLAPDPVAALALQTLLFRGQLPGARDLKGGDDLLGRLHDLAHAKTATGVERDALLADVVQELATPSSIAQRDKGTCAATSVEIHLIKENPAEYVRLVSGLASPRGTVELASGNVLRREVGTRADDGSDRTVSQRLLAPALMELANESWDYDSADDVHSEGGEEKGSGLTAHQVDVLLEAVHGRDFTFGADLDSKKEKAAAYELIAQQANSGEAVLVGLKWGDGGHKVVVTGTTRVEGGEEVTFINPWGREESMPKSVFLERLRNFNYDPAAAYV